MQTYGTHDAKMSALGIWQGSEHVMHMKAGRVLGVDLLHKNGFKFLVYFLLVVFNISEKYCFISFLYLTYCKLFEVFQCENK